MMGRNLRCSLANRLWQAASIPASYRFKHSLSNCHRVQQTILSRLLHRNASCVYGREHGFSAIQSEEVYRKRVPLTKYEAYTPYIERLAQGERGILTEENVLLFEPSSGTSSARKLVPYTRSLKTEFQHAIAPWVVSLFAQFPSLVKGRSYWSITPPAPGESNRYGLLPVGFEDDWSYLGGLSKRVHSWMAVLPPGPSDWTDLVRFRCATLACLLAAQDLALISIWSPSFLRIMLEWYLDHRERVFDTMIRYRLASRRRTDTLRFLATEGTFEAVWPYLKLISCWTDAASEREAKRLAAFFPGVQIQGKGLIATEAFISFPYVPNRDPVLAVRSHYFEFLSDAGEILPAHRVREGEEYEVIVTTGGGLYRYRLQDRICVTGFVGNTPTLRFIGKSDLVSDRHGEKLNAQHVTKILRNLLREIDATFAMLAPTQTAGNIAYTLYIESPGDLPPHLSHALNTQLQANPNYRTCISLGQLQPARVFKIEGNAVMAFESGCLAQGQQQGNIKLTPLSTWDGWSKHFQGSYTS